MTTAAAPSAGHRTEALQWLKLAQEKKRDVRDLLADELDAAFHKCVYDSFMNIHRSELSKPQGSAMLAALLATCAWLSETAKSEQVRAHKLPPKGKEWRHVAELFLLHDRADLTSDMVSWQLMLFYLQRLNRD